MGLACQGVTYVSAAGEAALRKRLEQEREWDRQKAEGGGVDPKDRLKITRCALTSFPLLYL